MNLTYMDALGVVPGQPGLQSDTPIFDQIHDEIWPPKPVRYVGPAEFKRAYIAEAQRWAGLSERLKASGD